MSKLKPVRIPARVVIVLSLWIAACAGGPSSSGDSGTYSPSEPTSTDDSAAPAVPAPPVASRDAPPDRPWTAPERKFFDATAPQSVQAPTSPDQYYLGLVKEWKQGGRLPSGEYDTPLFERELLDGSFLYSEYTDSHFETEDGTYITRIGMGFAIKSNYRWSKEETLSGHNTEDSGVLAWLHINREGKTHGPAYVKHKPADRFSTSKVAAVGAFTNGQKSGVWWECNEAGAVVAVGEYRDDARVGIWCYYGDTGWLTDAQDETGGGNGLALHYELKVVTINGLEITGVMLLRSGQSGQIRRRRHHFL